jgi:hypothetical protein
MAQDQLEIGTPYEEQLREKDLRILVLSTQLRAALRLCGAYAAELGRVLKERKAA